MFKEKTRQITCQPKDAGFVVSFHAMASPCELLIDTTDLQLAKTVGKRVANEAWRIEDKYSRYKTDSACGQLNAIAGKESKLDDETFRLLSFAQQCFEMSDGLFDITSGILRKAWQFDGSENIPQQVEIDALIPLIGWQKTTLTRTSFYMPQGMELDFGGIGKEYAVDSALNIAKTLTLAPMLVNFGGDLAVNGSRHNNQAWQVGIEHPSFDKAKAVVVSISHGAIATSGDAHRFLLKNGHRYSHILNVKTGWPVINPPNAITVAAPQCIQAGFLATLALLQGEYAEQLLTQQNINYWAIR